MSRLMSDRDVRMAEAVKAIMRWKDWEPGVDGYIVGEYRGKGAEVVHIKDRTANQIIEEMVQRITQRKTGL